MPFPIASTSFHIYSLVGEDSLDCNVLNIVVYGIYLFSIMYVFYSILDYILHVAYDVFGIFLRFVFFTLQSNNFSTF